MGKKHTRILMQFAALAMVLTTLMMVEEAKSIPICNFDTHDLDKCRPAVDGNHPPPPTPDCCALIKAANLECACKYKSYISIYGVDPSNVKAALVNCGVNLPSCFRA